MFSVFKNLFQKIRRQKEEITSKKLDQKLLTSLASWRFPRFYQLKLLPHFLSQTEKLLLKFIFLGLIIGFLIFALLFFSNPKNFIPRAGGTLREGMVGQPRFINPLWALSDADKDLSQLIFSSLVKYDKEGNLVNDLASDFEIQDNGKTYIFSLKEAFWHDGEPVQAEDIVFTIKTIQDPSWKSPLWRSFQGIQVEALNERTVKFTLEKPFAPFLHLLTVGIIPAHIWQEINPQNLSLTEWKIKPIGSGPWRFHSLRKTKDGQVLSYTLEKNNNYYGEKPWLSKVAFFFYDNFESAFQALKEGRIDSLGFIQKQLATELPLKRIKIYEIALPGYTAIFFNSRQNKFLEEKAIRQALSLSLDRNWLRQKIDNGKALTTPLPSDILKSSSLPSEQSSFNLEQANKLIESAGFQKTDNFWQKKDKALEITLTIFDSSFYKNLAQLVKESWEKIGIKTNINILSANDFKKAVKAREYEALIWTQIVGRDFDLFPFWHSSQIDDPGLNLTSFRHRQVDVLLEEARATFDPEKRNNLYLEFQKIISEETPAIFLFQPIYFYAISKKIHGVNLGNLNSPANRFAGINEWYIKKRPKLP